MSTRTRVMGYVLPDDFVRAALPLCAQATARADALTAAVHAAEAPAEPGASDRLARAHRRFRKVQIAFDDALWDAGYRFDRPGPECEPLFYHLRSYHGAADVLSVRLTLPNSPAWATHDVIEWTPERVQAMRRAGLAEPPAAVEIDRYGRPTGPLS